MASIDRIMIEDEAVTNLMRELQAGLASSGLELEGRHAVAAYIGAFDAVRRPRSYNHVPKAVGDMIGAIETAAGPSAVEDYHRLVLLTLIQQFDQRATACRLPPRLRDRSIDFLAGIVRRLQKPRPGHYRLDKDNFQKDLAVARLKLWPCGAEHVDVYSGIPRRLALHSGPSQLVQAFGHICLRIGGFRPFFETHFDTRMIRDFSADGYRALYLTIAQMLEAAPDRLGVFSGSWWHDPAVAEISPNLAFLNALPLKGGAKLYRLGADDQTIAQATRLSKERTDHVQNGTYRPTNYLLIWARNDLLRWARAEASGQTAAAPPSTVAAG